MRYDFIFKLVSLFLAVCCPIIMTTMFPLESSLSWYWTTPAVPLFILTTAPTSYFFFSTIGWKLQGLCLMLVTAFPVNHYGNIHNLFAVLFFITSGYTILTSNKVKWIKPIYIMSGIVTVFNLLLGEVYLILCICLYHAIVTYRQYKTVNKSR